MIDMRSDTVTKPTKAMREAMAQADVGDDVFGDDPTVLELERRVASLLGKEAAVFMPSGTMTNQVAIRTHTEPGDEVLLDQNAHVYLLEGGAPGGVSGVVIRPLAGVRGVFTAADVKAVLRPRHAFMPSVLGAPAKLLCVENTHNLGGGTVWPLEAIEEVTTLARDAGMGLHLDGARLWHATVKTGISEARYAAAFDTVSVCFSKGLGAPIGSALAGSTGLIERARRFKTQLGGGMRQAGIVAAGALHALENHRSRLREDHDNARALAEGLATIAGVSLVVDSVETNIVRFDVTTRPVGDLVHELHAAGLYVLPAGPTTIRAIPNLGVTRKHIDTALDIIRAALR